MSSVQKGIRLPEDTVKEIEALASSTGQEFSGLARDLLIEAMKVRRCPGITFVDGPTGRRARIAGAGIDILELIATFKGLEERYQELKEAYHWLNEQQIRAVLSYYALYSEEIHERISRNEQITEEQISKRFPFPAKPQRRS